MLALRLPPKIEKRLDALAKKTGRTRSFYAREAILVISRIWRTITWRAGGFLETSNPFPLKNSKRNLPRVRGERGVSLAH